MKPLRKVEKRWLMWEGVGLFLIIASLIVFFFNPTKTPLFPQCIFRKITGWYCPGCGSGRGFYQLIRGNFRKAWHLNPALILGLFLLSLMFLAELFSSRSRFFFILNRFFHSSIYAYSLFFAILVWWVVRNILGC